MVEYDLLTQVNELKPRAFRNMENDAISLGIGAELKKLASKCGEDWEILSHNIVYYENREILSLLIRRKG